MAVAYGIPCSWCCVQWRLRMEFLARVVVCNGEWVWNSLLVALTVADDKNCQYTCSIAWSVTHNYVHKPHIGTASIIMHNTLWNSLVPRPLPVYVILLLLLWLELHDRSILYVCPWHGLLNFWTQGDVSHIFFQFQVLCMFTAGRSRHWHWLFMLSSELSPSLTEAVTTNKSNNEHQHRCHNQ